MEPITTTADLISALARLSDDTFVTVDTEFIRETTFWPNLCLIQIAGEKHAFLIDALAKDIDLAPFYALMADESVIKVFHAARQDLEIIHHQAGIIPHPLFDTQVAAMVLGYGDSISYDALVRKITGHQIDKSHRFTDWARRPLNQRQLTYALADVTYLRDVYARLADELEARGRSHWVSGEMDILTDPQTYEQAPENAWKRLKIRVRKPRQIATLMEVAAWRESEAQKRDLPRGRVLKDDAIYEIAAQMPQTAEDLAGLRTVSAGLAKSPQGERLLGAIRRGLDRDPAEVPKFERQAPLPEGIGPLTDLLKVLLKMICDKEGVAQRVVATVDDLEKIAADDEADVAALKGWRRELFGDAALKLKRGELGLAAKDGKVVLFDPEKPRAKLAG